MNYYLSSLLMVIYLQKMKMGRKGEHFYITASEDIICLNVTVKQSLLSNLHQVNQCNGSVWFPGREAQLLLSLLQAWGHRELQLGWSLEERLRQDCLS